MSARLTMDQRDRITKALMEKKFTSEDKAIAEQESALALAIYEHAFTPSERRAMSRLRQGMLPETTTVACRIGSCDVQLAMSKALRVPYDKCHGYSSHFLCVIDTQHPLATRYHDLRNKKQDRKESKEKLRAQIRTALWSASTAKKLIEIWPEVADTVRQVCGSMQPVTSIIPKAHIEALNRELGLEQGKKKAA